MSNRRESGIATRDGFMGVYISRVGDETGGRWARGLYVEQLHGVPSECCGVWKRVQLSVVASTVRAAPGVFKRP